MTGQRMVDDIFDWTHDKLSGRVHTVNTDVRCFISEDRERLESPELVSSESTEYEAGGKRRIRVLVFKDSKSVYQYDTAGHQIESVTTEPDGQFRDREISTFDVDGRLVSTLLEFHDGEKVIQHFAYSSMGFSVELTATGRRVVETYDIAGNRMLSEVYGSEGKLVQKQIFDYDSQQRLTEIVTSTTWMHERVIERTQTGGPTTTSRRPLASKVDKATFSYDRDGHHVRVSIPPMTLDLHDESHRTVYETYFKINPQGGPFGQGSKREITSRDTLGNWLTEAISTEEDGSFLPFQVSARRIVYFP